MTASAKNAMKERLMIEASRISMPLVSSETQASENKRFNSKKFEKWLNYEDYEKVSKAFKNGEIDFNYIPKSSRFIYTILIIEDRAESHEILKKYYEAGTLRKVLDAEFQTFEQLMVYAIGIPDFVFANMLLDLMIPAMLKEIDSDDFKVSKWRMYSLTFKYTSLKYLNAICSNFEEEMELIKFFSRWNHIFADNPIRHWKLGTIDCPLADLY